MTREELNQRYPWMRDTELFQHANGGGWVERPDRVAPTAYIEGLVYGNAQVYGDARVSGNAQVSGDARVYGNARLLTFGPIGSRNGYTYYALDSDTIMCGCFTGTLDQFADAVKRTHGENEHGRRYAALIEILRKW